MSYHRPWMAFLLAFYIVISAAEAQVLRYDAPPSPRPGPAPEQDTGLNPDEITEEDTREPLGGRIPLIVVHGWNSNRDKWDGFSDWFSRPNQSVLKSRYKLYRFSYDWHRRIEESGIILANEIDQWFGRSAQFSIVAHSMGGLVSRSAIENYSGQTPGLGERLQLLVTLGTPHHGTPMANPAWLQNYSRINRGDPFIKLLTTAILPLNNAGGYGLGWDNSDEAMPADVVTGNKMPKANLFIKILNDGLSGETSTTAASKYVAIGAYHTSVPDASVARTLNIAVLRGERFLASRIVLARFFQNSDGVSIKNYVANDYIVPLQSALFLNDKVRVAKLTGEEVEILESEIKKHDRVREAIAFSNIEHSDLPNNPLVLQEIAKQLLLPPLPIANDSHPIVPISAPILVIDRSGSISDRPGVMQQVQSKAEEVVRAIQQNVTQAAVINFSGSGSANVDADFTNNPNILRAAIQNPTIKNKSTAVYDAVIHAVDLASQRGEQTMLVLLTDGVNHEGRGIDEAVRYCQNQKTPVPIIIVGFEGTEGRNDEVLRSLAERTGGFYVLSEQSTIEKILQRFRFFSTNKAATRPRGRAD